MRYVRLTAVLAVLSAAGACTPSLPTLPVSGAEVLPTAPPQAPVHTSGTYHGSGG